MDLCCFNRPFDDQSSNRIIHETEAKLLIQDMIHAQKIDVLWSYILDYENAANPDIEVMASIAEWKNRAKQPYCSETNVILEQAHILRNLGLGVKDALHIACVIAAKADFFITTDDGIIRKRDIIKDVKVVNPMEFVLPESEAQ